MTDKPLAELEEPGMAKTRSKQLNQLVTELKGILKHVHKIDAMPIQIKHAISDLKDPLNPPEDYWLSAEFRSKVASALQVVKRHPGRAPQVEPDADWFFRVAVPAFRAAARKEGREAEAEEVMDRVLRILAARVVQSQPRKSYRESRREELLTRWKSANDA
jgi:hypothetical protein